MKRILGMTVIGVSRQHIETAGKTGGRMGTRHRTAILATMVAALLTATAQAQRGLTLNYYAGHTGSSLLNDGTGNPLSTLLALTPTLTSNYTGIINYPTTPSVGLRITSGQSVNYSLLWTGWFNAPVTGNYTFNTTSDDGSVVYIDRNGDGVFASSEIVVNNNYDQGPTPRSGTVALSAQSYRIAIAYYQGGGGDAMSAQYQISGGSLVNVDTSSGLFFLSDPNALALQNLAVSNVTMTAATLYGNLIRTGTTVTATSVFWGQTDRYPSTNGWDGSYNFGNAATGVLSTAVSGLTPNQLYYFRFYATNAYGGVCWATNVLTFTTLASLPVIANVAVSNVTTSSAFLTGFVVSTGVSPVTVSAFYGPTNGQTNWDQWANTNTFAYGQWDQWTYPTTNITLLSATDYYYTYYSTNSAGDGWATNVQYFITGELSLNATDPSFGVTVSDTGAIVVSRPNTCTNQAVTVYYTTGGDATNGVQYTASPASGVLTIPAGQTNATITLTAQRPWNTGGAKSVTLTLAAGPYAIGAGNNVTCILQPRVGDLAYKMPIVFSGYTNRTEALTNFPVLVVFSNGVGGSTFNFGTQPFATTNGYDLRFTDATGATALNYEIESWNTNQACYVWVQVPVVPANGSGVIWAKWGDPTHISQLPCTTNGATWASAYRGVWHLGQVNALDSTANTNNGVANGNTNAVGVVATGQGFAGNQYITCGNAASVNVVGDMTLSAWVNRNATGEMGILSKWGSSWLWDTHGDKNSIYFNGWVSGNATIPVGQWVYLSVTFANATKALTFYYNGLQDGTNTYSQIQGTGQNLCIGSQGGNASCMNGLIDEARLEATPRSSNWVWACYMNLASNVTFASYGQTLDGSIPLIANQPATNVTTGAANMNGNLLIGPSATLSVFWGTTDGGTVWNTWANTNAFAPGQWAPGDYPTTNISPLAAGTDYYYTYYATNAVGGGWASPSSYFITGELTAQTTDPVLGSNTLDTATVTISRPNTCTNGALTVYYTLGGTAASGVNYAASPASGNLVIPSGQTNATLTLTPILPLNFGSPMSAIVTLAPGAYAIGAANSATCTIQQVLTAIYTWDGSSADWTNATHWTGGLGGTPRNGSTGIIANGTARINGTSDNPANGNLYNPANGETPPGAILIRTNGTLYYNRYGASSILDHNFVLDGGTFMGIPRLYSSCEYDHDIAVKSPSVIDVSQDAWGNSAPFSLIGEIKDYDATHTGQLTVRMGNANTFGLSGANAPFTGGWIISGAGTVLAGASGAFGTGNITVGSGSSAVWMSGTDTNMPTITVGNGGSLLFGGNGSNPHYSLGAGKTVTIQNGGHLGTPFNDYQTMYVDAPLTVSGNVSIGIDNRRQTMYVTGDIVNSGPATIAINGNFSDGGTETIYIGAKNSSYAGNWIVSYSTVCAMNDGGLGTGLVDVWPGTILSTSTSRTLYNILSGGGTAGTAGTTLTLQPRYRNATLTYAGVAPGTNFGSVIGTLAVTGNLSFTNLPNYDGAGHNADCKLTIKFGGTKASPSNDLLTATGNILGLSNVDLTVTAAGTVAPGTYPILVATNNFSGQAFHSVAFSGGATGRVFYNNYNVQVQFQPSGTTVIIR